MNLQEFFQLHPKVALAFSGGVDSSYLLYAAKKYGADICAYYVKSQFQPKFEYEDAMELIDKLDVKYRIINIDLLSNENIKMNSTERCYFCKKEIFSAIRESAINDGYEVIIDGTNYSDDESDRAGMRVLKDLSIYSPLRICSLTKDKIRELSKEAGLFTWDKPAYACLATRIQSGEIINEEKLSTTEKTENFMTSMGFKDFRIRTIGEIAKIEVSESQIELLMKNRNMILQELKKYYKTVVLDLEVRDEKRYPKTT